MSHPLEPFITTSLKEQERLYKQYKMLLEQSKIQRKGKHAGNGKPAQVQSRIHLLDSALSRINKKHPRRVKIISGSLKMILAKPRKVTIAYHDTNEVEEIVTIPQLALVGELVTSSTKVKFSQNWVGRVFPQWKGFKIKDSN
ncbi:hypothetical protein OAG68_00130 [bacterium]|nr:hypothetical protein [bacterium]